MCHYSEVVEWETFNEQLVAGEVDSRKARDEPTLEESAREDLDQPEPADAAVPSTDD